MGFNARELNESRLMALHSKEFTTTYYVNGQPYCLRPLREMGREDMYCSNKAGMGASHGLTEGPCKHHGGNGFKRLTTGRYAGVLKRQMRLKYEEYEADPATLNIQPELHLLRVLLGEYLEIYRETRSIKALELTFKAINDVTATVERIEHIQSKHTLTMAMTKLLMTRAIEVAKRFLAGDDLIQFVNEWESDVRSYLETPADEPQVYRLPLQLEAHNDSR